MVTRSYFNFKTLEGGSIHSDLRLFRVFFFLSSLESALKILYSQVQEYSATLPI